MNTNLMKIRPNELTDLDLDEIVDKLKQEQFLYNILVVFIKLINHYQQLGGGGIP